MQSSFSGGVFSESLNGGRAGAEIQLLPSGIAATCPDGEAFAIPYHGCDVEMGGFNGKMVFCRNADRSVTIFCDDRKFASALSLAASGTLDEQLTVQRKRQRGESRRSFGYSIAFLVSTLVLIVAGYFGIRAGANAAVLTLPTSVDVQIGETAMESMDLGGPKINDEIVVGALQSIVDRLAPAAAVEGMQFRVHVVDSPMVNAFALPGGNMVVYTGLIESAESPEQVAGVLAHEMKTQWSGGFVKGVLKRLFGGESMFVNTFSTTSGGELVLTQPFPGDIQCLELIRCDHSHRCDRRIHGRHRIHCGI